MIKSKWKNIFLHLRLPFSYFLLPVFLFGLSESLKIDAFNTAILFVVLHFFIYPASNAYNSYMDKDTGSIGALKNPPPVTKALYHTSIFLDVAGILLSLMIDVRLSVLLLAYIGISKAYSWTGIRLKKYPVMGWLFVVLFQGGYTFLLVSMSAENNFSFEWFTLQKSGGLVLSTLLIGAYYPLTQIYQHEEDSNRGDITISYKLGITGTFIFSALLFIVSVVLGGIYFNGYYDNNHFLIFLACLLPAVLFFLNWFYRSWKNQNKADFSNAMRMTVLSSTCLNICFIILLFLNHS